MSKEIILKILYEIKEGRKPSSGFIFLIERNLVSSNVLDFLSRVLAKAIKQTKDKSMKRKFMSIQNQIKNIKLEEQQERLEEQKELQEMEDLLSDIDE